MWKKSVMRISRELSLLQIVTDQKALENVQCFNCLGSMVTNDARCICEIKSRISMVQTAFNRKNTLFTTKLNVN
jgi:hypothetical protein